MSKACAKPGCRRSEARSAIFPVLLTFSPISEGFRASFRRAKSGAIPATPRVQPVNRGLTLRVNRSISRKSLTLLYNTRITACRDPPPRHMGPRPPGGGTAPGTQSRARGRWDPKPALGLATGGSEGVGNDRSGRSGGVVAKGAGFDTCARVREVGQAEVTVERAGGTAHSSPQVHRCPLQSHLRSGVHSWVH